MAQLEARHLAKVKVAGSNPVSRSQALLAQLAEAPRSDRGGSGFESRGGYLWPDDRMARCRPAKPVTRVRLPLGPPWRVNQAGAWASLLTSARLRAWASTAPLSAYGSAIRWLATETVPKTVERDERLGSSILSASVSPCKEN